MRNNCEINKEAYNFHFIHLMQLRNEINARFTGIFKFKNP